MTPPVCIIGAGPAGLAAARALRQRGIAYEHLERHTGVGGIWDIDRADGPMYESAHFISSKTSSGFDGFPMPEAFPDYPGHRRILAYLRDFANAYGLTDRIEFGVSVESVTREGNTWVVTRADGKRTSHQHVIVCTGSQWHPSTPELPGDFAGEVRHACSYRSASEFAGKRVLIVGGGNSGCDIACDAAQTAAAATISMRRGYWFIPKHVLGRPSDVVGGSASFLPKSVERVVLQPMLRLLMGDPRRLGLQQPDHKLFESHPVINTMLFHALQHGDITARPGIATTSGNSVTFTDGSSGEFDLVMFATGYQKRIPIAQEYFGSEQHPELYLNCISRRYPGLFAIGFTETNSGAFQIFDRQAQLIASYLVEQQRHPGKAAAFAKRILTDRPDLTGGIKFVASPRHVGYVDSERFVRVIERTAQTVGWELRAEPPVLTEVASVSCQPVARGAS